MKISIRANNGTQLKNIGAFLGITAALAGSGSRPTRGRDAAAASSMAADIQSAKTAQEAATVQYARTARAGIIYAEICDLNDAVLQSWILTRAPHSQTHRTPAQFLKMLDNPLSPPDPKMAVTQTMLAGIKWPTALNRNFQKKWAAAGSSVAAAEINASETNMNAMKSTNALGQMLNRITSDYAAHSPKLDPDVRTAQIIESAMAAQTANATRAENELVGEQIRFDGVLIRWVASQANPKNAAALKNPSGAKGLAMEAIVSGEELLNKIKWPKPDEEFRERHGMYEELSLKAGTQALLAQIRLVSIGAVLKKFIDALGRDAKIPNNARSATA